MSYVPVSAWDEQGVSDCRDAVWWPRRQAKEDTEYFPEIHLAAMHHALEQGKTSELIELFLLMLYIGFCIVTNWIFMQNLRDAFIKPGNPLGGNAAL